MNETEIKLKINEKAHQIIKMMRWQEYKTPYRSSWGLNYPYAISFTKCREGMNVNGVFHPDLNHLPKGKIKKVEIKKFFELDTPNNLIYNGIIEKLLPKHKKYVDGILAKYPVPEDEQSYIKWRME